MALKRTDGTTLGRLHFCLLVLLFFIDFMSATTLSVAAWSAFCAQARLWLSLLTIVLAVIMIVREWLSARGKGADGGRAALVFALKLAVVAMAICAFSFNTRSVNTWVMMVLAVTCGDEEEVRLFRTCTGIGAVIVVAAFILSMLGLISNNRGNAFGFIYRTHYACHLLTLAMGYCLYRDGRLSWRGEAGLVALFILNACFVKGKTLFGCLLLMMLGTFWRHYDREGGIPYQDKARYGVVVPLMFKVIYLPILLLNVLLKRLRFRRGDRRRFRVLVWSFVVCAAIMIFFSAAYRPLKPLLDRVPGLGTVKARLVLGVMGFEEFPIQAMGNDIPQQGLSNTEGIVDFYYALDSGYIKVLLEYGWAQFLALMALMTWTQARLWRARRYYAMGLLAIFAIDGLMEYWMIAIGCNLFAMLATCRLQEPGDWDALPTPDVRPRRSPARYVALGLGAAVVCWWCATAYPISTWSGWTPASHATLVVPGGFIDGVGGETLEQARLQKALDYLDSHADACCVLAGDEAEQMRAWLTARGVAEDRLTLDADAGSLEEMLENAARMIDENDLPPRMTVCTFRMQQARVVRTAREMRLPVNSLCADMPWAAYLPNYLVEQWKILL